MHALPSGTVTFLFTDIEDSAKLWSNPSESLRDALTRHDSILQQTIEANGGYVYKVISNTFRAAFSTASQAVAAAVAAQHALLEMKDWEPDPALRTPHAAFHIHVRMAMHTGVTDLRDGEYVGPLLNRVARLLAAGHGGQILLTLATQELARDGLAEGITLHDMGEHRLRDLILPERIFQVAAPGLTADFAPLKTLEGHPNNLPLQPTPLIGRQDELEACCALLADDNVRLLTLLGPGGIGKTRLALQVAAELLDDYKDGVFFAPLAAITDPEQVIPAIGRTVGVEEVGIYADDALKEYLRDKAVLLLLDNFEHLLAAAPLVPELVEACPGLKILITSRTPLSVRWEQQYPVPSMDIPNIEQLPPLDRLAEYESMALFVARAQSVNPGFRLTEDNAKAVAEICYGLDGLPLAIELAAARTKILAPQAMLDRLNDSLKLLVGGARDLPKRQQTLRGTIDWSYNLLEQDEKALFARLGVFRSGCMLEAVEAVCGGWGMDLIPNPQPPTPIEIDILDGLESLIDKSLVQQQELHGEPRFEMLETVRGYALEKLEEYGEAEAMQKAHAEYFTEWAKLAEPGLKSAQQKMWLEQLEAEHDNMRAALQWSRTAQDGADLSLRLVGVLGWFWEVRGYYSEGREQLSAALARVEVGAEKSEAYTKALNVAGRLAWQQGEYVAAKPMLQKSLSISRELGDKQNAADSLHTLGNLASEQGDFDIARSSWEESLALRRELGDKWGIANSLHNLGNLHSHQGDTKTAVPMYKESLALRKELGDRWGISYSEEALGYAAYYLENCEEARTHFEENLAIAQEMGDKRAMAKAYEGLGHATFCLEDYEASISFYKEGLALSRELRYKWGIPLYLEGLAAVYGVQGFTERAAILFGAAESLREEMNVPILPTDRPEYERNVASARVSIDNARWEAAWQEGRDMDIEQAIAYALEGS